MDLPRQQHLAQGRFKVRHSCQFIGQGCDARIHCHESVGDLLLDLFLRHDAQGDRSELFEVEPEPVFDDPL